MRIQRSANAAVRKGLDTSERWLGPDQGVIAAWERGRQFAVENSDLAGRALAGELIVLPWKGGVERALKNAQKYGAKRYLAMWQGMRREDLDIDLANDQSLVCTATGVTVIYTNDVSKYAGEEAEKSGKNSKK